MHRARLARWLGDARLATIAIARCAARVGIARRSSSGDSAFLFFGYGLVDDDEAWNPSEDTVSRDQGDAEVNGTGRNPQLVGMNTIGQLLGHANSDGDEIS